MDIIFRVFIKSIEQKVPSNIGLDKATKTIMIVASGSPDRTIDYYYDFLFSLNKIAEVAEGTIEIIVNGVVVDFKSLEKPISRPPLAKWFPLFCKIVFDVVLPLP